MLDLLPVTIGIFAHDGTALFCNRAGLKLHNITDANLIIGKYNLLNDPVYNDQLGLRDGIQKAFLRGEAFVWYDVVLPIEDLVNRGVISESEKPFEKGFTDWYLIPIMSGEKVAYVAMIYVVKKLYYGRPDLVRAREHIESNWLEEYDPQTLAKTVNMSVTQLYKVFKENTGMTPGNYHKNCKVEHIKEKLADKNLSVKQAFAACGEDSQGRIARVFKKLTGMSPRKYRENIP